MSNIPHNLRGQSKRLWPLLFLWCAFDVKSMSHGPCHVDELIRDSGSATTIVNATLTMMVPDGMVKQVGGMQYVL